jgi:hypothetical protein
MKTITSLILLTGLMVSICLIENAANAASWTGDQVTEVTSQHEDGWAAITTNEGVLFVWNLHGLHFTLAIKGKEVKPINDPDHIFFNVDGRILQIQLASIKDFAPDAKQKKLDDRSILAAHRNWESNYIEGLLKSKLTVQTFNAKLSNGSAALMWQYDMPKVMNAEAKKQLYVTAVKNDYVLMLNSEATAAISDADGRKFLMDTIATFKPSPTPIDVKQLSESIRKGVAP